MFNLRVKPFLPPGAPAPTLAFLTALFTTIQRNVIYNLGYTIGSTLSILAYLNLAAVWIAFCLSIQRLEGVSSQLNRAKKFVNGYMIVHVMMCVHLCRAASYPVSRTRPAAGLCSCSC